MVNVEPAWVIAPCATLSQENVQEDIATLSVAVAVKLDEVVTLTAVGAIPETAGAVVSAVTPE